MVEFDLRFGLGERIDYSVARSVHFPNQNAYMLARFVVFDRAGNVANFDKPLYWMARCAEPGTEMLAVFDPDDTDNIVPGSPFTGFVPYVAGMEVKTNPVRMLIRIPLTEWWETSTFGVSFYHRQPPPVGWPLDPADFGTEGIREDSGRDQSAGQEGRTVIQALLVT